MPGLLYTDDFVLCAESEEDLKAMMGRFVEVCRRRSLKSNVMALNEEDGLKCEVCVGGIQLRVCRNLST